MTIGTVDLDQEVFLIAEIGNNHEGDIALAERMIGEAAEAGAHAVKFQTIIPEQLVAASQTERIAQLRRFQLSYEEYQRLSQVAAEANVVFMSTPFDLHAVPFLSSLVPAFKIASGDNTFFPLIEAVAQTGKPILLSTGMTTLAEVRGIRNFVQGLWQREGIEQELALLHCVVSYPTVPAEANLRAITDLQRLGVMVGYSDHTLGIEAAVLSVALGARIIEKHFTLDKHYSDFRDHQLSADPAEFAEMAQRVQQANTLLGTPEKKITPSEEAIRAKVRRSIVAGRDLAAGHTLVWEDLAWVRPGEGLPPGQERRLLGKTLQRPVAHGDMLLEADVA